MNCGDTPRSSTPSSRGQYHVVRFNAPRVCYQGAFQITGTSINPRETERDFRVFQRPVKAARKLYLSLPRRKYNVEGPSLRITLSL